MTRPQTEKGAAEAISTEANGVEASSVEASSAEANSVEASGAEANGVEANPGLSPDRLLMFRITGPTLANMSSC